MIGCIDSLCWALSTYSVKDAFGKQVGRDVIYPGIENTRGRTDLLHYTYYQWVPIMLLSQVYTKIYI